MHSLPPVLKNVPILDIVHRWQPTLRITGINWWGKACTWLLLGHLTKTLAPTKYFLSKDMS
jgi:hypothetical protein